MNSDAIPLTDLLALSHVPRWSIVPRTREQSVADHTFRVMVITVELATQLNVHIGNLGLLYILIHDVDECRTGDVSSVAKPQMSIGQASKYCPWLKDYQAYNITNEEWKRLVKVADLIEAATWIERYGAGDHSAVARERIIKQLLDYLDEHCPVSWKDVALTVIEQISCDYGR